MKDLGKVSSEQLFLFWKNFSISLLTIVALVFFSRILPHYYSPIIALICAAFLFTQLYNSKYGGSKSCMVISYGIFFCIITYSFLIIILNVLHIWGTLALPKELIFFNDPFIPGLLFYPSSFIVMLVIYLRRHKLALCVTCRMSFGDPTERGRLGHILSYESDIQIKNLLVIFGIMSVIVWSYYFVYYETATSVNGRDWYVYTWLYIAIFILDELYFAARYYNLYLDLKENDEIITPDELHEMGAKTYLRFYAICGEDIYVTKVQDKGDEYRKIIDTPFFSKQLISGLTHNEAKEIAREAIGCDGELKFFFGRKLPDMERHSLLRYFYYISGTTEENKELGKPGYWMSFARLKEIYSFHPTKLSPIMVADITRLATIMLTQKVFDEEGYRKNRLLNYRPTFTLAEVHDSDIDFQDDKWIKISMFNSDTRFYRFKKWRKNRGQARNNSKLWR